MTAFDLILRDCRLADGRATDVGCRDGVIAELGVRSDIVPGKVSRLRLTPDKAGSYAFNCDVFCGSGHEDMGGTLIVTE